MLEFLNKIVWGLPLLVLLLGTGLIYSINLGFFQIKHFPYIIKNTFFSLFSDKGKTTSSKSGSISQFQAASSSLAAAMGTGNIAGVAAAITIGGAGSIFWMWISAVLGMALVYGENYLGAVFRKQKNGKWYGGPMAYLEQGAKMKNLAVIFAVCCAFAALGMGNMTQVNTISLAINDCFSVPVSATGIASAILCALVISGGIKRIGSVTQIMIPFLTVGYIGISMFIIICNYKNIPGAFSEIFRSAFGIRQAGGGISGVMISQSINIGLRRGVFSNEAGLGSSAVLHSAADSDNPQQLGSWAVFEVFIDTIVCCTLTAFVILTTKAHKSGKNGIMLVSEAFKSQIGMMTPYFIAVSISLFAFATIIGWFYCGECAITYIFGEQGIPFYKFVFIAFVFIGAVAKLEAVWIISDIFNGLMAIPNLIGLNILRKKVKFSKKLLL